MSDRIHQITRAVRCDLFGDQPDPSSVVIAIRDTLKAEFDEGHRAGYGACLRDAYEIQALADKITTHPIGPPLDADGRSEAECSLHHCAVYIPEGRTAAVVKLLNDNGVGVYRMWPVENPQQMSAAMDELHASLNPTAATGGPVEH